MARVFLRLLMVFTFTTFFPSCEDLTDDPIETPQNDPNEFGGFCLPPIQVDTTDIQMQMDVDGFFYLPTANFSCIIPNIFLDIDQLWINGSIPPALRVITLMMPVDITPGEYPLQLNSPYDARYVPSGAINFTVDGGVLVITTHDIVNQFIEGGFEFRATNLDSPVLPVVEFTSGCFQAYY